MDAFKLAKTPDGGLSLTLNVTNGNFTVQLSSEELRQIRERMEAWHRQQHANMTGADLCDVVDTDTRKQALRVLTERLEAVTPYNVMGAAANQELKKRGKRVVPKRGAAPSPGSSRPGTQPVIPRPGAPRPGSAPAGSSRLPTQTKAKIVSRAASLTARKRAEWLASKAGRPTSAQDVAAGKVFARSLFLQSGVPLSKTTPSTFWLHPEKKIADITAAVINKAIRDGQIGAVKRQPTAAKRPAGLPAKSPPAGRVEQSKLAAVKRGLTTVATRRARFLAAQGKRKVARADIQAGKIFARDFFTKNQIPATNNPAHQFWDQPLQILVTKVSSVVKLAEVQGAPAKPPKASPSGKPVATKPVKTKVATDKVSIIRAGLRTLAARRAKLLAKRAGRRTTSFADLKAGQDFARSVFIKRGIPVKLPGKSAFIAGWVSGCDASAMGQVVTIKVSELAPKLTTGELAHAGLNEAVKTLERAKAVIAAKSARENEKAQLRSTVEHMEKLVGKARSTVPAKGPISESQARTAAAHILLSTNTLNEVDRFAGASLLSSFTGRIAELAKKAVAIVTDVLSAFWAKPAPAVKADVDAALKSAESEAPADVPGVSSMPPAPGRRPPGVVPGGGGGGGGGGSPGYMPGAGAPGEVDPGETPGEVADGTEPGATDMPAEDPAFDAPPGQLVADATTESALPDDGFAPGELEPGAGAPGDVTTPDETPGVGPEIYEEPAELSEAQALSTEEESALSEAEAPESDETFEDDESPSQEEAQAESEELSTETNTAGEDHMAIELGWNFSAFNKQLKRARLGPGAKRNGGAPLSRAAKKLRKRGLLQRLMQAPPTPSNTLGETDIMGADFVLGQAAKGDPAAKKALKKTLVAAKKGSPSARKNVKALAIASRRRKARGAATPVLAQAAPKKRFSWFRLGPA